jgi:hypothetical protein
VKATNKDEVPEEKGLAEILAAKLRAQLSTEATGCLSAEVMAAYVDRALTPEERATCEAHILTCAHCQDQVAELTRLIEADEITAEQLEAAEAAPKKRIPWGLAVAWAIPLALILTVAAVKYPWSFRFLKKQTQEVARLEPPAAAPEEAPAGTAVPAPEASPAKRATDVETPARRDEREFAGAPATAPPPSPAPALGGGRAEAPSSNRATAAVGELRSAASAAHPPSAELRVTRDQAPEGPLAAEGKSASAAPAGKKAESEMLAPKAPSAPSLSIQGAAPRFEPKWRVGKCGLIQKLDSSGRWVGVPSGVSVDLYDITFAGPSVAWIVGQAGTVLRSTDGGQTWERFAVPTDEDLVRVSSTGRLAAQVMSRGGQTFLTRDGGKTWTKLGEP